MIFKNGDKIKEINKLKVEKKSINTVKS